MLALFKCFALASRHLARAASRAVAYHALSRRGPVPGRLDLAMLDLKLGLLSFVVSRLHLWTCQTLSAAMLSRGEAVQWQISLE